MKRHDLEGHAPTQEDTKLHLHMAANGTVAARIVEESERTEEELEEEFERRNEAVIDTLCDATGNAAGWCAAQLLYWIVVGITVFLSRFSMRSQYGMDSPMLLAIVAIVVLRFVLYRTFLGRWLVDRTMERLEVLLLKLPPIWGEWHVVNIMYLLDLHTAGAWLVYEQWYLGYFVYEVWIQLQFQLATSELDAWQSLCSLGNTAFTPTYPEGGEKPSRIFAPNPTSSFGFAVVSFSVFTTWLTFTKTLLAKEKYQTRLLVELLHQDNIESDIDLAEHQRFVRGSIKKMAQSAWIQRTRVAVFTVVVALATEHVLDAFCSYLASPQTNILGLCGNSGDVCDVASITCSTTEEQGLKALIFFIESFSLSVLLLVVLLMIARSLPGEAHQKHLLPETCRTAQDEASLLEEETKRHTHVMRSDILNCTQDANESTNPLAQPNAHAGEEANGNSERCFESGHDSKPHQKHHNNHVWYACKDSEHDKPDQSKQAAQQNDTNNPSWFVSSNASEHEECAEQEHDVHRVVDVP